MTSTPIAELRVPQHAATSSFTNEAAAWGLDAPSFSNGAAYGDLDGDGALDLVVNNVNDEAFVYRNNARTLHPTHRYLQVRLEGDGREPLRRRRARDGARAARDTLMQELAPTRGFQSSVDYVLTFGLGARDDGGLGARSSGPTAA